MRFLPPVWYDKLPSTNTVLRDKIRHDPQLPSGTVIAAREQTAGRGRQGQRWISYPGRDLCFSFLVKTRTKPVRLASLAMTAAIGVSDFIATKGISARVKWPNDVLVNKRKISGILVDAIDQSGIICAVVGIGININMTYTETRCIEQPATSILCETGTRLPVEAALTSLLPILAAWISRWLESGFTGISQAWHSRSYGIGKRIGIKHAGKTIVGVLAGFGPDGQILLQMDGGSEMTVSTGRIVNWY